MMGDLGFIKFLVCDLVLGIIGTFPNTVEMKNFFMNSVAYACRL